MYILVSPVHCRSLQHRHERWDANATQTLSFSFLAAAQLAMDHFNAGNPSVVPELQHLQNCSVYFPNQTTTVLDSQMVGGAAVQALWKATQKTDSPPCAVLGPMDSRAAEDVTAVTAGLQIPNVLYYAELNRFAARNAHTVATVLSPHARATVMAEWLLQQHRQYVAVIHFGKDGSSDLAEELVDVGLHEPYNLVVRTFQRNFANPNSLPRLLDDLFETGITTIVLNFDNPRSIKSLARALDEKNMLGDEYLYILSPDAVPTNDRLGNSYDGTLNGSPLDRLFSGALVFDQVDPFRLHNDDGDAFLSAWRQRDAAFVKRLNALHPLPPDHESYYQAEPDFFQTHDPANLCSFVYDAVMTLGFGGCLASEQDDSTDSETTIGMKQLVQGMTQSSFHGASGPIAFENASNYRAPKDITVGLYNIRSTILAESGMTNSYHAVRTALYTDEAGWQDEPGTPILYRDGTTHPPVIVRDMDNNYLSARIRASGLFILALTWLLVIGAIAAIHYLRSDGIIQRAQPFFLILICIGSLLTSVAIFTLSWDEGVGATNRQLDWACMATPWFFFLGHITTFMALFTKLWRVDKVLQFRRTAVTIRNVLGPLVALSAATILILGLWTALDPLTWERTWISRVPAETYGQCTSEHLWVFLGPLMGLLVSAELLAAVFAWKTFDIPQDFGDSRTAVYAICAHVQSWCVGVPILAVLEDSSTDATYFGRVFLIWIFSISSVMVVVGPKIYRAMQLRIQPDHAEGDRVIVTGISAPLSGGSKQKVIGSVGSNTNESPNCSTGFSGELSPEEKGRCSGRGDASDGDIHTDSDRERITDV